MPDDALREFTRALFGRVDPDPDLEDEPPTDTPASFARQLFLRANQDD